MKHRFLCNRHCVWWFVGSEKSAQDRKKINTPPRFTWTLLLACSTYKMKLKAKWAEKSSKRHNREKVSWGSMCWAGFLGWSEDRQCVLSFKGEWARMSSLTNTREKPSSDHDSFLLIFFCLQFLVFLDHFFSDSRESSLVTVFIFGLHSHAKHKREKKFKLFIFIEIPLLLHIPEHRASLLTVCAPLELLDVYWKEISGGTASNRLER